MSLKSCCVQAAKLNYSLENHFQQQDAQCFYRQGHAYIIRNPMVCLMGPTTNFYDFEMGGIGIFQNKCFQSILGPCYF